MHDFLNHTSRGLKGYTSGEQPTEKGWIKLNTNENPYPPSPKVMERLRAFSQESDCLRKYPHPLGEPLRSKLAAHHNVNSSNIVVFNGSDEALAVLTRTVLDKSDDSAFPEISYSLYPVLLSAVGSFFTKVAMDSNLKVPLDSLAKANGKLKFITTPNAPTGEQVDNQELYKRVVSNENSLWVVDEAYQDFSEQQSFASFIPQLKNAVVVRTFSKSYALAGLRVGYLICSNAPLVSGILAMKDSYNLDALAIELAIAALSDQKYFDEKISKIKKERRQLHLALQERGFEVMQSAANFIFARPPEKISAERLYKNLKEKKILVRYFSDEKISSFVRISLGNEIENKTLLFTIDTILQSI